MVHMLLPTAMPGLYRWTVVATSRPPFLAFTGGLEDLMMVHMLLVGVLALLVETQNALVDVKYVL